MEKTALATYWAWHSGTLLLAAVVPPVVLVSGIHHVAFPGRLDAELPIVPTSEDITGISNLVNFISYMSDGANWV